MDGNVEITFPLGELAYKALAAEMNAISRFTEWYKPDIPLCIVIGNVKFEPRNG